MAWNTHTSHTTEINNKKSGNVKSCLFILLIICNLSTLTAQTLIETINRTADATFTITAYSRTNQPTDTTRGFFISSDGLAITCASILLNSDSLVFSNHRNRNLHINRVIAIHPYSNLAIISVSGLRGRLERYLTPSRTTFTIPEEILLFAHPTDEEKAENFGETTRQMRCFYIGRCSQLRFNAGKISRGAPAINGNGQFVGIYQYVDQMKKGILMPVFLINDDYWETVNQPWSGFKTSRNRARLSSSLLMEALVLQADGRWLESARAFTSALRLYPEHAGIFALRSISRVNYGNNVGAREDFTKALQTDNSHALPGLAKAIYLSKNAQPREAVEEILNSGSKNEVPAEMFILLGQLQEANNDIRRAHASYSHAIELDSLCDEAYYERGRLTMHHASNQARALEDLTRASQLNPSLPGVFTMLGNIRLNQNDYLVAIRDFDKALLNNPDDIPALMNRGIALYNTGRKDKACEDWSNAGKKGDTQAFKLISRYCSELKYR